jgi:hypothetical protein
MKMGVGLLTPWQSVQIRSGSLLVKACNVGNQPGIAANTIRVDGPGPQSYIMRAIGELVRTHHPLKVVTAGSIPAWPTTLVENPMARFAGFSGRRPWVRFPPPVSMVRHVVWMDG